jgi:two-component system, NarL family, nitrate/nitrite response regulator NarL
MDGMQGLQHAVYHQLGRRVALMSADNSLQVIVAALAAGAAGFVPKTLPPKSFLNAIKFMLSGETYLPAEMRSARLSDLFNYNGSEAKLNQRELAVLRLLGEGKVNRVIGRELGISEAAVKQLFKSIFRQLGVTNRTQAAISARELGLVKVRSNASS